MNILESANKFLARGATMAQLHAPGLLTAAGIAGFAVTIPVAISCKKRQDRFYMEAQDEKMQVEGTAELTKGEAFKVWAHAYWPTALTFSVSAACVVSGLHVSGNRLKISEAALVAAQGEMQNLKETIKEQMSEKESQKIFDKTEQKNAEKHIKEGEKPIETGLGSQLCCDLWSGRTFYSDVEHIRRAFNDLNEQRLGDFLSWTSYNDLFYYLGLEGSDAGRLFGWEPSMEGSTANILPDFTSGITEDGITYLAFRPSIDPVPMD